jgi:hypothetical protein
MWNKMLTNVVVIVFVQTKWENQIVTARLTDFGSRRGQVTGCILFLLYYSCLARLSTCEIYVLGTKFSQFQCSYRRLF